MNRFQGNNDISVYQNTTNPTHKQTVRAYIARDGILNITASNAMLNGISKLGCSPNDVNLILNSRFKKKCMADIQRCMYNNNDPFNGSSFQNYKNNFMNSNTNLNYRASCNTKYNQLITYYNNNDLNGFYNHLSLAELNVLGF